MAMTPGGWLAGLEPRLDAQARECALPERYYDGNHPLAFATDKFRQTFGSLFHALAVNWCALVVDALVERLRVEGFRFGQDETADDAAWNIWQGSNLDLGSRMLHSEAVKCGRAYTLVEPPASPDDPPRIYTEHPSQVIVAHAPGRREQRVAALKKFLSEDDGFLYAYLYLPEGVYKWRSQQKANKTMGGRTNWGEMFGAEANPMGVVPVVPFYNRPTMLRGGRSDLEAAIPIQDILNKLIADMLVDSEATAFVQRIVTGWSAPTDPETGQPLPDTEIKALRSKLLTFKEPDVKVTELQGANLERFVAPVGMVIQHFAAVTRMPPHYLLGQIVNVAGDALTAAEAGLVHKAEGNHTDFGESHEETLRVAFLAQGDTERAKRRDAETIWGDPEKRSEAEKTDAAVKQRTLGVPLEILWEGLGFTQTQIKRMVTLAGLPERPPPGATTAQVPSPAPQVELPAGVTA